MLIRPQKLKYEFKRNVCMVLTVCVFVVIGAGCAAKAPSQGYNVKIHSGQDSVEASWPK